LYLIGFLFFKYDLIRDIAYFSFRVISNLTALALSLCWLYFLFLPIIPYIALDPALYVFLVHVLRYGFALYVFLAYSGKILLRYPFEDIFNCEDGLWSTDWL